MEFSGYLCVSVPPPAHEEASNFRLTRSQQTIVGMFKSKIDDRATITIDFIGTVSSNPGHRAYVSPQIMAISVGTMTF